MEPPQSNDGDQAVTGEPQPHQLGAILRSIDELVEATLASNEPVANEGSELSAFQWPPALKKLDEFNDMMTAVRNKVSEAMREVQAGLGVRKVLKDLVSVGPMDKKNQLLSRSKGVKQQSQQSFKLREFSAGITNPQLINKVDADTTSQSNFVDPFLVLKPTRRNVAVLHHAYARLLRYKEAAIKSYLASVDPRSAANRYFKRDNYENQGMLDPPTKNNYGNLLDVERSSYSKNTQDLTLVLVFKLPGHGYHCEEPVTGTVMDKQQIDDHDSYLALPATETSLKKLYDAYVSLKKAVSAPGGVAKDREFEGKLREVQNLLRPIEGGRKKRQLALEDDADEPRSRKHPRIGTPPESS
ncbi:hypothetical protein GGR54DRAFT_638698 [Hypoxylon sp. NC1633]|nr:hypothetical protein GGR54DRAFT_638698 [Hypoxylon sp. NC1633]